MRVASMVLGIVGGVLAIITAIVFIVMGGVMASLNNDIDFDIQIENRGFPFDRHSFWMSGNSDDMALTVFHSMGIIFLIAGSVSLAGGVLGIVGGSIVKKKNVPAGVLLIIAAVLCASVLFTLAAIFALVHDKKNPPPKKVIEQT